MKHFKKNSILVSIIVYGLVIYVLTAPSAQPVESKPSTPSIANLATPQSILAQNPSQASISDVLKAYEESLSSPVPIPNKKISDEICLLLKDRQDFYQKYFDLGLHSDLSKIESEFDQSTIKYSEDGTVEIVELVTLKGTPKLQIAVDYPAYKAALLAIEKVKEDKELTQELEEYASGLIDGVQQSIDGGEFTIKIVNKHKLIADSTNGLLTDEFSSKSIDDPGIDKVIWVDGKSVRIEPDFTLMPDYKMYITPIDLLAEELLKYFADSSRNQLKSPSPESSKQYSGSTAAAYIRTWVRVTKLTCAADPVYQDQSSWNPAYSTYYCNDCANYVSQALAYGGMATTETWRPYTPAWINVTYLGNYIIGQGFGFYTSSSLLGLGDLGIIPGTHIVMVSALNPLRYSGHTSDRLNYPWQSSLTVCINVF